MNQKVKNLIQKLGEAIHETVSESEDIAGVVKNIREQGFDVLLMLEATIGLNEVEATRSSRIGRGQCVEHYGEGEAYLPVLESLGRLCREPDGGERVVQVLAQYAPTWLVQMPSVTRAADLRAIQRRAEGLTRHRMLRELAEAVEALAADTTLIFLLEDLHWSDVSTLD